MPRADETAPLPALSLEDAGPEPFDEDESGVIRRGARIHTPPLGMQPPRRSSEPTERTPPLGVEIEPPAKGVPVPSAGSSWSSEPPPMGRPRHATPSVGFRPPSSRPPAPGRPDRRTPPIGGQAVRTERVTTGGIDAVSGKAPSGTRASSVDDPEKRAMRILETLRTCGPDDEGPGVAALLKVGLPALEPMEREFPGLLWFHRRLAHQRLPRGRDVGSLARAIVAFGEPAAAMMLRFLEKGDIDQRFYAVLIAGDLMPRCREATRSALLESVGRRLRDVDAQVSDAAVHVLMHYREDPAILPVVGTYVLQMGNLSGTPSDRVFAARVLGVLRVPQALSAFIERLDDPSPLVRDAARKALRLLTGEDLGSSRRKWASWARKHGGEHRVRWLIEGLIHRDEDLRTMAHRELVKVAATDFGYSPDMSRGDRKRIYRECLAWFREQFD